MRKRNIIALTVLLLLSLFAVAQTSFAATTRDEMMTIAESYKTHIWVPTENNVCSYKCCTEWNEEGECAKEVGCIVNTPDRNTYIDWDNERGWEWKKNESGNYLQSIAVPYQWGGCSSIGISGISLKNMSGFGDFDAGIENKKCAGDARGSDSISSYAVGVDCSGFVSRAWNLKAKKSTYTLPKISRKLSGYDDLEEGDLLNKRGHAMLFNEFLDSNNLSVYESMGYYWKVKTSDYNIANLRDVQKYKPYTSFPSDADVEIVIDASYSMNGDNLEKAKEAMNYFMEAYKSNARIGIVGFSDSASVIYPLTMLENSQIRSDIKETVSDYLDFYPRGETHIAKGLKLAREELNEDTTSNSSKVIILISDGYESPENISESDFVAINDVLSQIAQDGIVVHTIRMGWQTPFISPPEPELVLASQEDSFFESDLETFQSNKFDYQSQSVMIIPDLDHSDFSGTQAMAFLRMIAEETGGGYQSVFSLESFMNICTSMAYDFYQQERTLKTMYGGIFQNQIIFREFFVDPSMETATFSLFWPGSELDFSLIRPDGIEITPDSTSDDISFSSSKIYKIYEINTPMNGLWQLKIYGKEVSYPQENYAISIGGLSGIDLQAGFDKDKYSPNSPIKISASVIDQILDILEDQYVYGANVKAEVKDPEGNFYSIAFSDIDNNGIYTGEFSETSLAGQYDFTVEFNGISNAETSDPFTREKTISAIIVPDLSPIADAGGPYTITEGTKIIFDAVNSTDPDGDTLQYRWDFDNDGNWDTQWLDDSIADYTWNDDYQGEVKLEVSDGELTDIAIATVTINNANPTVNAGEDQTVEVFDEVSLAGSFTDQGWLDTHTASIDWGDGTVENIPVIEENSAPEANDQVTVSHVYDFPRIYTAMLTIIDDDGGVGIDELIIIVRKRETALLYNGNINGQYSDQAELKAILTDKVGGVADKTVHFFIGNQSVSAVTNGEGMATAEITLNQIPGNYTVETSFQEDNYYFSSFDSDEFKIFKENVFIIVENQEGYFNDTVILSAAILDDDEETLYHIPNKASFTIGDHQIGKTIISETGQAKINWTVDYIPTDLNELYSITVTFNENEYYLPAEGQGEFILKGAKQLKQDSLAKLKTIQSDNKQAQNDIDKAIENIENSLEPELWIDASRLDQKHGHKVFDREKQAIKNLLKIIEEKGRHGDFEITAKLQAIVDNLIKVDILLAKAAIYDAENITVGDYKLQEKIEKEISKAKEELEKAF